MNGKSDQCVSCKSGSEIETKRFTRNMTDFSEIKKEESIGKEWLEDINEYCRWNKGRISKLQNSNVKCLGNSE